MIRIRSCFLVLGVSHPCCSTCLACLGLFGVNRRYRLYVDLDTEVLHVVGVDALILLLLSSCSRSVLVAVEVRRAHNLKNLYDEKNLTLNEI